MAFSGNVSYQKDGIIDMGVYRPHLVIPTPVAHHVYPLSYFQDFADGKEVESIPADVMVVIVKEWLNYQKESGV